MKAYFQKLNQSLKKHSRAIPFLLIDLDKLDQNIATFKTHLNPTASARIVVKSLPCVELLDYISKKLDTEKYMVFHQPFLTDLASQLNYKANILLGKPMPINTAAYFYKNLPDNKNEFNPYQQVNWLIDTNNRLNEYIEFAKIINQKLKVNLEIDVGLHRGGFDDATTFSKALQQISKNSNHVQLTGLMGYDPHVVKLPKILRTSKKALELANQIYTDFKNIIQNDFPELWTTDLTFNGAGSPTINLHNSNKSPLNDISVGSCFVKPATFDIPTLSDYVPASFIATPVLKAFKNTTLPALENKKWLLNLANSKNKNSYFIYGGFWKADYHYPPGIQRNSLFGDSTNQTMLNAPVNTLLEVDDFVFLRPHQSEFVLLQFGNILTVRNCEIYKEWTLLKNY